MMGYLQRKKGLIFLMLVVPCELWAMPRYLMAFRRQYPQTRTVISCKLCHNNDYSLNSYGRNFAQAHYDFQAIENLDSDEDGFRNGHEIRQGTFPGDAQQFPSWREEFPNYDPPAPHNKNYE